MQYHCSRDLVFVATGANLPGESFARPYQLLTLHPATGVSTPVCTIVDTSLYRQVIALADDNTLALFTGSNEPSMGVMYLVRGGRVSDNATRGRSLGRREPSATHN